MHRWIRTTAAAFTVALMGLSAACGDDKDDGTGPNTGDTLTPAETQALLEVLFMMGELVPTDPTFSLAGAGGLQVGAPPFNETIDETEACELGGTVKLTGTLSGNFDEATETGDMNMDVQVLHSACKGKASTGQIFTIDGSPKIGLDATMVMGETTFSYEGALNGTVKWATGGKQGTCTIAMSYDFHGAWDGSNYGGSSSGTVCGTNVSDSF